MNLAERSGHILCNWQWSPPQEVATLGHQWRRPLGPLCVFSHDLAAFASRFHQQQGGFGVGLAEDSGRLNGETNWQPLHPASPRKGGRRQQLRTAAAVRRTRYASALGCVFFEPPPHYPSFALHSPSFCITFGPLLVNTCHIHQERRGRFFPPFLRFSRGNCRHCPFFVHFAKK